MVSLTEVAVIRVEAPWMKQALDLSSWTMVDGKRFIKLSKMDPKISRLLLGEAPGKKRGLSDTNIVEELVKLRNAAVDKAVMAKYSASTSKAEEDLGVGTSEKLLDAKRRKIVEESLPKHIDIDVPGVGGSEGYSLSVLTVAGQVVVSVELVAESINFLHKVVETQLSNSSKAEASSSQAEAEQQPEEQPEAKPASGVWWYPQKKAWRVKYMVEGKQKYKFFKPSDSQDPVVVANAEAEAKAFAVSMR